MRKQCSKLRLERAALKRQLASFTFWLSELEACQRGPDACVETEPAQAENFRAVLEPTEKLLRRLAEQVETKTKERFAALWGEISLLRERRTRFSSHLECVSDRRAIASPNYAVA